NESWGSSSCRRITGRRWNLSQRRLRSLSTLFSEDRLTSRHREACQLRTETASRPPKEKIVFHEDASLVKHFSWPCFLFSHPVGAARRSFAKAERHGAVKGAPQARRQRTLDCEYRSATP